MYQLIQSLKDGTTSLVDIPVPTVKPGCLLIKTTKTLVSAGTEKMLVDFGKANFLQKAKQQPDKVKEVWQKIKTDGLKPTLEAVRAKLDQPLALGYCNVGIVLAVGAGVNGFKVGDRVASNGPHAEIVCVPKHLCALVPDGVSDEEAAFTVISSIALQGIRLASPTLGETVAVMGLGLVGLVTVQLLLAQGCRVVGMDFDKKKLALAASFGANVIDLNVTPNPVSSAYQCSNNRGIDAVLITASSKSDDIVHHAAEMSRKRGRIILVGVVGLNLSRSDFYEKELTFQVSCSYGPGRYDNDYELKGQDYPLGFVRWTEQRNFEAVLALMEAGRLNITDLISHRYRFENAIDAYTLLSSSDYKIGILLEYKNDGNTEKTSISLFSKNKHNPSSVKIGFIGAGNFASRFLIPAFKNTSSDLVSIITQSGLSGTTVAKKIGIQRASTNLADVLEDEEINTVVISTRHDTHAELVKKFLMAGKHVYVEKPLVLHMTELDELQNIYAENNCGLLMIGFNRRFAPHSQLIKKQLVGRIAPIAINATINAGFIPADHWTQDLDIGGGRLVGEACHFIDLCRFFVGCRIVGFNVMAMDQVEVRSDKVIISLSFSDGSVASIQYLANGHKSFPKERFEIFSDGRILQLDNFRKLSGYGWTGFKSNKLRGQDKGHQDCINAFVEAVKQGKDSPITAEEIFEVSRVCLELQQAITNV